MDKLQCIKRIAEVFPECELLIKQHLEKYGEILLHVLSSELIHEPLIELLRLNKNRELIQTYCDFIEEMWKKGDADVINVVEVSVLERLSDDTKIWQRFGQYISDEFRTYINEQVLTLNMMMAGTEKLSFTK